MSKRSPSLKWPLTLKPLAFHLAALLAGFVIALAVLIRVDSGGQYTTHTFAKIAADAVIRNASGELEVQMTPGLADILDDAPNAWFLAEDQQGRHVSFGEMPPQYASLVGQLGGITFGDLRGSDPTDRLAVALRQETGPAGKLTVIAHGELQTLTLQTALAANILVLPLFLLLAAVSIIVTPIIVKRSLAGVRRIAEEARRISSNRRGIRLTETAVPVEIAPLVRAVNDALDRLDDGYESQRRFIAAAAHELRTPIAILRVKVDASQHPASRGLAMEIARLSTLAEQLLDLHRMDAQSSMESIELVAVARRVVADLAPLLIANDRTVSMSAEKGRSIVADSGAIERVITNLVQNAVQHGGRHVVVRVYDTTIEVEDDGPGIPPAERERVFEPFQRIQPRQSGAGLGLNLVRQVVDRHGGRVTILDAPDGGALIRVELPAETKAPAQGSRNVAAT